VRDIETENNRLHPGLKIKDVRWLGYVEGEKEYASLILRVESASQANRLIQGGVVMRYDLKNAENVRSKMPSNPMLHASNMGTLAQNA
jgi:hypothetical protein